MCPVSCSLLPDFGFRKRSRRRGGKVEISRGGRDLQGTVGAVGNLGLVFHGFSTALLGGGLLKRMSTAVEPKTHVEPADHMRAVVDRHGSVQVFVNGYGAAGQRAPKA